MLFLAPSVSSGVISEFYPAVVSVFPATEGYTSSCKDKASQKKLRMDPNRNELQLQEKGKKKRKKETETTAKHNPQKAVLDEKKPGG